MKVAFSSRNKRIAPIFDLNRELHILEIGEGSILNQSRLVLEQEAPFAIPLELKGLGVELVVCGAISRFLEKMLLSQGIRVIPFMAGGLQDVIDALLEGALSSSKFAMPGCKCRVEAEVVHNRTIFGRLRRRHRKA